MKTLSILSIVQAAFLMLLLLSKKQKSKSGGFLAFGYDTEPVLLYFGLLLS
jgi:hypothetical protein